MGETGAREREGNQEERGGRIGQQEAGDPAPGQKRPRLEQHEARPAGGKKDGHHMRYGQPEQIYVETIQEESRRGTLHPTSV